MGHIVCISLVHVCIGLFFSFFVCTPLTFLPLPEGGDGWGHAIPFSYFAFENGLNPLLAIFQKEITTILTPSTMEGGEWGRRGWSRFSFWKSLITNPEC